jgi:N-terminal acetyltransferase B complex catalytic subunit
VWRHTVLGKAEGRGTDWHGHVTAVTVAPEYRRLGLGERLMSLLEHVSHHVYAAAALCSRALATAGERPRLTRTHDVVLRASHRHDAYFVDLFVRVSNQVAVSMYKKFGYVVYRQVMGYYSGEEDAYGTS